MTNSNQVTELLQAGIAAAQAAAQAGRAEEARRALLRVTELDERSEQAWLWLSGVVETFDERRICLENVLAINPDNAHAQAGLHWLDQQAPAPSPASERCPLCGSPIPQSGSTCPNCGQLLIVACPGCGEYIEVQETMCPYCGQPLGNFRDGAHYHIGLAQAYLEQQNGALAQEAIACAEAAAGGDAQILRDVAALREEMGHTDMAIATYKLALEHAPDDASLYAHLGAIYRRRAMPAEAIEMYKLAAQRASDDPAILYELADLYNEEYGAAPEVFKLLERAVHLNQEHAPAHFLLAGLYLGQGQGQRAIQHYEQAAKSASPDSLLGRDARRALLKLRPPMPKQAQGWGETLRLMTGLMISPALAALVNARLVPWEISLLAWVALIAATGGAYLWVCATEVTRNPAMCSLFGEAGVAGRGRKALVGLPGMLLWAAALGLILGKI